VVCLSDVKENVRAIGIDDGHFRPRTKGKTKLVAVLLRADSRIEGILCSDVEVDALNSTHRIITMLENNKSKFLGQASVIFLDGVNFAGFNIVDVDVLQKELMRPIIIVFRRMPDLQQIFNALQRFDDSDVRINLIKKAGTIHKAGKIFFQCRGITPEAARKFIEKFSIHSHIPEPVRVAHLIASATTLGHSTAP